jgi:hypothetical protein
MAVVAERFLSDHVRAKRKPTTHALYEWHFGSLIGPELGTKKVTAVTHSDVAQLHRKLGATMAPTANRVVATLSSLYSFCGKNGIVPEGFNPAKGIEKFRESSRERFLTYLSKSYWRRPWCRRVHEPLARFTGLRGRIETRGSYGAIPSLSGPFTVQSYCTRSQGQWSLRTE